MKVGLKTKKWDPLEFLQSEDAMIAYLEAALEENDPVLISAVIGDIARAKGMAKVAKKAGLGRESLYKSLSDQGNPELATILKVLDAVGIRLHAKSAKIRPRKNARRKPAKSSRRTHFGARS
jgi:probable addiction module antidote protein